MNDPNPNPDPLVAALTGLRPAPAAAEKPAFLFRAGQASREALARRWRLLAALAGVALVGSWAFWFARYSDALARAELAEQRVAELTLAARPAPEPPHPVVEPPPSPISSPVVLPPLSVPVLPPSLVPDPYPEPDATPQELADALRLRNDILLGGLTMLPQTKAPPPDVRVRPLPGGVFATPQLEPNKLPPVLPDDDN